MAGSSSRAAETTDHEDYAALLEHVFRLFDTSHSGALSGDEVRDLLPPDNLSATLLVAHGLEHVPRRRTQRRCRTVVSAACGSNVRQQCAAAVCG